MDMDAGDAWWRDAVVYQIYPRSFNDSDGDGVGDLPGIVERLDYLDELGVDVVWLTPVYASPQVDNGYDTSDYRSIHPEFGTMADWEALRDGLHARDMKLIMDLAVNHTSDEHEWFQRARESVDSEYRDYYIWQDGDDDDEPPNNWESHFGGPAWEYDERTDQYYLHLFHRRQPDLNWANPDVREAIYDVMHFWLEQGIDGFRLDVLNLLSKPTDFPDGDPDGEWVGAEHFVNGPRIMEYLQEMHEEVFANYDCMTVGEMPELSLKWAKRYVSEDRPLDMAFHFELMQIDFGAAGRWDIGDWTLPELKRILATWQSGLAPDGWNTPFLENHDQPRAVSRFGDDDEYRVASAKLLATMQLTLRGTPFIYQGQEIGMTNTTVESLDVIRDVDTRQHAQMLLAEPGVDSFAAVADRVSYRSRDNARTPMQWQGDAPHAGFTDGEPWIPVNPNYTTVNVADARMDPDSVWHHYRSLLDFRARHPVLAHGDFELYLPEDEQLFVYRRFDDEETLLVVLNVSGEPARFGQPDGLSVDDPDLLLGTHRVHDDAFAPVQLRPYEGRVYRI
jgi:glycosidase